MVAASPTPLSTSFPTIPSYKVTKPVEKAGPATTYTTEMYLSPSSLSFIPPPAPGPTQLTFDQSELKENPYAKPCLFPNDRFWGIEVLAHDLVPKYFDVELSLVKQKPEDVEQLMMLLRQRFPAINTYQLDNLMVEMLERILRSQSLLGKMEKL